MSFETGGRADKLGNRYEGWWVAKQLVRLLQEEISSVIVEAIGDDEQGVDVWIENNDGTRQAQQCKARNGSKENWSVSDLKSRGVLGKIKFQLDRNPNIKFAFVSAATCLMLRDICIRALNSSGDAEHFYTHQIKSSKEIENAYKVFCIGISENPDTKAGRQKAFEYLCRLDTVLYADDENARRDLRTEIGYLLTGQPELIISSLITYAESNYRLGRPIYANDLYTYFEEQNVFPKNLARDNRILPNIQRLQEEFTQSVQPLLIKGSLIPRKEAKQCLVELDNEGLVIITGESGVGKSGILHEITSTLKQDGVAYIPLRVDRLIPRNSARQYGEDVGLPDSPVTCLAGIAGGRPSVLIIDQLDAIRWTSAHSSNALDVCKEMVNQVLSWRRLGKDVRVVLCCRSFDLRHDVELRNWLEDSNKQEDSVWKTIEVAPLAKETVCSLIGPLYNDLNQKQQQLLLKPQNLFMWFDADLQDGIPILQSATALMRGFWDSKIAAAERQQVSSTEIWETLDVIMNYTEKHGRISVPSQAVFRCSKSALYYLQSAGILKEQGKMLSFSHQSYLDFLIASRVVKDIEDSQSILNWLGEEDKQTLFRREQLRLAMSMVREDNLSVFTRISREILFSDGVRFHLKNLTLEVIGAIAELDYESADLLLELISHENWKSHVIEVVLPDNAPAMKFLIEQKVLQTWLESDNQDQMEIALNLLQRVKEKLPIEVGGILRRLLTIGEQWWPKVMFVLNWNVGTDSDEMLEMRLKMLENKIYPHFISWKDIVIPSRAILIIEALLKSYSVGDQLDKGHRFQRLYDSDLEVLRKIAKTHFLETWDRLMPQLQRLVKQEKQAAIDTFDLTWCREFEEYNLTQGVIDLITVAGQQMAVQSPEKLIGWVANMNSNPSKVMQRIIAECYACLPAGYADTAIRWLLEDLDRLELSKGIGKPSCELARFIIKNLSPYCSLKVFKELEQTLQSYHHPQEIKRAKESLAERRKGVYWPYWGREQYLLLTQLSKARVSQNVLNLLRVLERKYNGCSDEDLMDFRGPRAGFVSSTLRPNLFKISDQSWLQIVRNEKVPFECFGNRSNRKEDLFIESSVSQFSGDLEVVAKHNPERFGKLALKFPTNVPYPYIAAILSALELKEFQSDQINKDEWRPGSDSTILAVVSKYLHNILESEQGAKKFCWFIQERRDISWPVIVIEQLSSLAVNHRDPLVNTMNVHNSEWDKSMNSLTWKELFTNSLNCVRGAAAEAIASLLWEKPELFEEMREAVAALVLDYHPSVRISAIGVLLPLLRIDRDQAVEWFLIAVKDDLRVACSTYAVQFINYTIRSHSNLIKDVVIRLINSNDSEAARLGSEMAASYYIFYEILGAECAACSNGNAIQRKGVVKAAASHIHDHRYAHKCARLLDPFLENYDVDVVQEISELSRHELNDLTGVLDTIVKYAHSSYLENDSLLIDALEQYTGSLLPFRNLVLNICNTLCGKKISASYDDNSQYQIQASALSSILLRLYEEVVEKGHTGLVGECLDTWDRMFEVRISSIRELARAVDGLQP